MKSYLLFSLVMVCISCGPKRPQSLHAPTAETFSVIGGKAIASPKARAIVRLSTGCSGSLIGTQYVLTAGHCLPDEPQDEMTVDIVGALGEKLESRKVTGRKGIYEDSEVLHSDFVISDLAVLKLESAFEEGERFALPEEDQIPSLGDHFYAGGFGLTSPFGEASDIVQEVFLTLIATDKTNLLHKNKKSKWIWDILIMDQHAEGVCSGDSGGPLYQKLQKNGQEVWQVLGVVNSVRRTQDDQGHPQACVYDQVYNPRRRKSESSTSSFIAVRPHMDLLQSWIQTLNKPD